MVKHIHFTHSLACYDCLFFLNDAGVKDSLAALEINCATIDESDTSAENLGTH